MTADTAYAAYRDKGFFGSLNGLRCLCILLVLWHHRPNVIPEGVALPRILDRGFTGVDFFFVLSGFLITTLLLREEDRDGRFSIAGFYRRRVLRIVPVYFLVVTLCAVWWICLRGQAQWWPLPPYYYAFLANFLNDDIPLLAPTWSLSVEEQYYLIWPALMLLLTWRPGRTLFLVGMIVLAVLVGEKVLPELEPVPPTENARFLLPMGSYAAILIGSLLAMTLHHRKGFAALWVLLGVRQAPLVLFAVLLALWQWLPQHLPGLPNLAMHGVMALILAALVVREDHVLAPVLAWGPIARIGVISYGLYLWHLIGLHMGNEVAGLLGLTGQTAGWAALPVYLAASIVIAEVSFRWFESHFLKMKSGRPKKQPA